MKLNKFKQLIRNIITESLDELEQLNEMAAFVNPGDPEKFEAAKDKFQGTWVGDMLDYIETNPGKLEKEIAAGIGKTQQQQINGVVRKFVEDGTLTRAQKPRKEKPATSGVQGRPVKDITALGDEEKVKRLIKQIKNYLRGVELSSGNPSPAPRQTDIDWFDQFSGDQYEELYGLVEDYVNSPSVATEDALASFLTGLGFQVRKRGRPMGSSKSAAEPGTPEDMPLEELLMMQKRAGIISEEEYRQKNSN